MIEATCKQEQATCPRCGMVHECKADSINLCHCKAVQLTEDQRHYVSSLFSGCLCASCLLALRTEHIENQPG